MAGIIKDGAVVLRFVAPLSIVSNEPAFVTESMNLKRYASSTKVQRWEITTNVEPSNDSTTFFTHNMMYGHNGKFLIQMPQPYRGNKQKTTLNIKTTISLNGGTNTIPVYGSGIAVSGDFIKFANHDKVYVLMSNGNNPNSIEIHPALTKFVPANTSVVIDSGVTMLAMYDSSQILGLQYTDGILTDPGQIKFIEAL